MAINFAIALTQDAAPIKKSLRAYGGTPRYFGGQKLKDKLRT